MKINKENLLKMADHIETVSPEMFHMAIFRSGQETQPECDSVGCVIGHCTVLDPNIEKYLKKNGWIDFPTWSKDFTGIKWDSFAWEYLFSIKWEKIDNTPTGAAKRIRYFVKHGLPKDWKEQMEGAAPLSYLNQNQ